MIIRDKVLSVFQNRVGEEFIREEIIDLVVNDYQSTKRKSVIPTDYCYNKVNKDKSSFILHLFKYLGDAKFRCLGQSCSYSGPIYWKRKGATGKGEEVGKWEQGQYQLWKDPREL